MTTIKMKQTKITLLEIGQATAVLLKRLQKLQTILSLRVLRMCQQYLKNGNERKKEIFNHLLPLGLAPPPTMSVGAGHTKKEQMQNQKAQKQAKQKKVRS